LPQRAATLRLEGTVSVISYNGCLEPRDFTLTVGVSPSLAPPANDECLAAEAVSLPNLGSTVEVAGRTLGARNDVAAVQCPGSFSTHGVPGREVFYAVTTGVRGVLKATATEDPGGVFMYVVDLCGEEDAWACGTSLDTGFAVPPGTYYVAVDQQSFGFPEAAPGEFTVLFELD
jgi:hypothetical protein